MEKQLTDKQSECLQKLIDEITSIAKDVVEDYNHTPISGSQIIQVHENSPLLKK